MSFTGKTVSHYRVGQKLGEGGMGVVYAGEDLNLDRPVALKFLAPHLVADADSRKRLIREAKAAASLDHPNICTVYEIDLHENQNFIAMALIQGVDLREEMRAGAMKLADALDIAKQTAAGLGEAHQKGIIHRDIKPSNIMLTETGSGFRLVKLMDFGLARIADQSKLTKAETTLGTIAYMSPEQTEGTEIDTRSDIWALGSVFYEMLTGQPAFRGHYDQAIIYSILNEDPAPVSTVRMGLPQELDALVARCLQKRPDDRYADCAELAKDIDRVLTQVRISETTTYRTVEPQRSITASGWRTAPAHGTASDPVTPTMPATSQEQTRIERKRGVRDVLLQHAAEGVLPDRVLTQALQIVHDDPSAQNPALRERHDALSQLVTGEVRVGEFVEAWQTLNDHEQQTRFEQEAAKAREEERVKATGGKPPDVDYRTDFELFGLPLVHRARGVDAATGKRRVAVGVIAYGEIAVGVVAIGKFAVGGLTLGWISLGLVSVGAVSLGLAGSLGLFSAGMNPEGAFAQELGGLGLIPTVALILVGLIAYRFHKARSNLRQRTAGATGVIDMWQVMSDRDWSPPSREFHGGMAVAVMSDFRIDLSEADFAGAEVHLEASSIMAHVKILVPAGTRVTLHGRTIGGYFRDKRERPPGSSGGSDSRLVLDGMAVLGEVTVYEGEFPESARKRKRREKKEARRAKREAQKQARSARKK